MLILILYHKQFYLVHSAVYFVYQSGRGKGHRFISNASKKGGHSYLGHLESNNGKSFKKRIPVSVRRKRSIRRKRTQKGGYCPPCLIPPVVSAMGLGTDLFCDIEKIRMNRSFKHSFRWLG